MTTPPRASSVAPRVLDPLLAVVERIDRWRRNVGPIAEGSLVGIESGIYRGAQVNLGGGEILRPGDVVWSLHLDNRVVASLADEPWPARGYAATRDDLRAVARRIASLPEDARPVALGGVTLLGPLARRLGFVVRPRSPTARVRLEDWYLRSLLARWAPGGRDRLVRGHAPLRTSAVWIASSELLRRYGPPPE